ncbi:hypothetical protein NDU88_005763 [Pleurodeles waltl]|uniref:Uncharacterized protein n=1 Tax=Pleurodeles waltl TaxID=8319 RepID=A0AAV7NRH2_PLEWA|nr:hypothetical protein NDU88_005763 [Pleurodeles waltl]
MPSASGLRAWICSSRTERISWKSPWPCDMEICVREGPVGRAALGAAKVVVVERGEREKFPPQMEDFRVGWPGGSVVLRHGRSWLPGCCAPALEQACALERLWPCLGLPVHPDAR